MSVITRNAALGRPSEAPPRLDRHGRPMPGFDSLKAKQTAVTASSGPLLAGPARRLSLAGALIAGSLVTAAVHAAEPRHGIAMHGVPALAPNFNHARYVNPQAPQGGRLTHGVLGT